VPRHGGKEEADMRLVNDGESDGYIRHSDYAALVERCAGLERAAKSVLPFWGRAWDLVDGRLFIDSENVEKFDLAFRDLDEAVHPEKRAIREFEEAAIAKEREGK
jgi:hypothetical protein